MIRESTRRHLDDLLFEYGRKVDLYLSRREQIKGMLHPGGMEPRVSGGAQDFEAERYVDMLNNDRQLASLYRFIKPISDAIAKLTPEQRRIVDLRYVLGMEQDDVVREMGVSLTSYYREKRKAMNSLGWSLFGVYC